MNQLNEVIFLLGRSVYRLFKIAINVCVCVGLSLHLAMFPNNRM